MPLLAPAPSPTWSFGAGDPGPAIGGKSSLTAVDPHRTITCPHLAKRRDDWPLRVFLNNLDWGFRRSCGVLFKETAEF